MCIKTSFYVIFQIWIFFLSSLAPFQSSQIEVSIPPELRRKLRDVDELGIV